MTELDNVYEVLIAVLGTEWRLEKFKFTDVDVANTILKEKLSEAKAKWLILCPRLLYK